VELLGVTRTIDHAVYTLLNSIAIILWRIDSALIGFSLLSYRTQDWLTGPDGGIWRLLSRLVGVDGIFGLQTYQVFLVLALTLFGLSRILRPFLRSMRAVDPARMLFFAVIAYIFITQGSDLLRQAEVWRGAAGGAIYQSMASGEAVDLGSLGSGTDLLRVPHDLDGQSPIRAWEAVATSYFLADSNAELHAGVPPADFLREYCLYDPAVAIDAQSGENAAGCSPKKAWDEWDRVSTQPITQVLGIPLPIDISLSLPIVQEHPENRQLGMRQAQQGVARLALGPVVALFPIVEANVGLMLALAASFIYLSLPITLLFGFFLYTEPMVTRLFMQFIGVFIRTLILNGLLALFMMVLMGVAADGSLTVYLGLVGVGLIGGFFLTRMAASTMRETLSTSLGAVGGVWTGAATGVLGEGVRRPAQAALGLAKLGAGMGAMYVAGRAGARAGATSAMSQSALDTARSGWRETRGLPGEAAEPARTYGPRLPAPLGRLVGSGEEKAAPPSNGQTAELDPFAAGTGSMPAEAAPVVPLPAQWGTESSSTSAGRSGPGAPSSAAAQRGFSNSANQEQSVEGWAAQVYQAGPKASGRGQVAEAGRALVGEGVSREAMRAMNRHSQAETMAVLRATRQAAAERQARGAAAVGEDGPVSPEVVQAVKRRLDSQTAQAFAGAQGERDVTALVAAGLAAHQEARPEDFQRAMAGVPAGRGEQAPGRTVPRALGLDPTAAGGHFAAMNRFARLSEQAGLTETQRRQLLREVQENGRVSDGLRGQIESAMRRQGGQAAGLRVEELEAGAAALPPTLRGPVAIRLPGDRSPGRGGDRKSAETPDRAAQADRPAGPSRGQPDETFETEAAPIARGRVTLDVLRRQ
jgi:hypothetical protein